jgi:hypothetical protein
MWTLKTILNFIDNHTGKLRTASSIPVGTADSNTPILPPGYALTHNFGQVRIFILETAPVATGAVLFTSLDIIQTKTRRAACEPSNSGLRASISDRRLSSTGLLFLIDPAVLKEPEVL